MKRTLFFLAALISAGAQAQFLSLHNGDRVVFYGDSITDGAAYTKFVEAFVRLRHPNLDVKFFNAGVGGDRVTGGWMGSVDDRLSRDLFSRKPTVITVMLGMNDGSYQAAKPEITDVYERGYRHIVDRFKKEAASAKVFLIKPSPFDDVTRAPGWPGGYNGVMTAYSQFVESLAKANGYSSVDFNSPVVGMLERAKVANADLSTKIIGDRVHPGAAGHLVMAEQLLLSWGATPTLSNVTIELPLGKINAFAAKVASLEVGTTVKWEQTDSGLPFPLDRKDAVTSLVLSSSDFDQKLNQQILAVKNLPAGRHMLKIDGLDIVSLSAEEWGKGVNLAQVETPMLAQARTVWAAVTQRADMMYQAWRQIEFTQSWAKSPKQEAALKALNDLSDDLGVRAREMAKPIKRKYEILPVPVASATKSR